MAATKPVRNPLTAALRLPAWFLASLRRYIGLIIATVLTQWALLRADLIFTGISGVPTPDTQNDLTVDTAVEQIRSYTPQAIEAYNCSPSSITCSRLWHASW